MLEDLKKYVSTDEASRVLSILGASAFAESLTRNRGSNGTFFFRIRDGRTTIGRSIDFESKAERDDSFAEFLDWIEVKLHRNYQRGFEFE